MQKTELLKLEPETLKTIIRASVDKALALKAQKLKRFLEHHGIRQGEIPLLPLKQLKQIAGQINWRQVSPKELGLLVVGNSADPVPEPEPEPEPVPETSTKAVTSEEGAERKKRENKRKRQQYKDKKRQEMGKDISGALQPPAAQAQLTLRDAAPNISEKPAPQSESASRPARSRRQRSGSRRGSVTSGPSVTSSRPPRHEAGLSPYVSQPPTPVSGILELPSGRQESHSSLLATKSSPSESVSRPGAATLRTSAAETGAAEASSGSSNDISGALTAETPGLDETSSVSSDATMRPTTRPTRPSPVRRTPARNARVRAPVAIPDVEILFGPRFHHSLPTPKPSSTSHSASSSVYFDALSHHSGSSHTTSLSIMDTRQQRDRLLRGRSTSCPDFGNTFGEEDASSKTGRAWCDAEEPAANTSPTMEPHTYAPWATELSWEYGTSVDVLSRMAALRIAVSNSAPVAMPQTLIFARPVSWAPTGGRAHALVGNIRLGFRARILEPVREDRPRTSLHPERQEIGVQPHGDPWLDLRSNVSHPDWLPDDKLRQYQAVESVGFRVWRADRETLICSYPECRRRVVDHLTATELCPGCGPGSRIRYCGKACLLLDMTNHWQECGDRSLLLPGWVDQGAFPPRYMELRPLPVDRSGLRSFARHRQAIHAATMARGQYTIFPRGVESQSGEGPPIDRPPYVIEPAEPELRARIARLLTSALRGGTRGSALRLLFAHVRAALVAAYKPYDAAATLPRQFVEEFGANHWMHGADPAFIKEAWIDDASCECWWEGEGGGSSIWRCSRSCRELTARRGEVARGRQGGVRQVLLETERTDPVLRAWRDDHPTVASWQRRAAGEGWNGEPRTVLSWEREDVVGAGWEMWQWNGGR